MWRVEQRYQQAQKTALNPLECATNSPPGRVHPPPSQWTKPQLSTSQQLSAVLSLEFYCPGSLHTCISPQFAFLQSSPSHHCSCGCVRTRTSFTEVISLKWGICILLWAENLCQQHKQEIFFSQLGRFLLGITRADFKLGLFQSWSSHFNPPELFFSDSLVCCWLLDKDEPRPIK